MTQENYNFWLGLIIKQLKVSHNLNSMSFINLLNLDLTKESLEAIEQDTKEIDINNLHKIISDFNLNHDKVYNYVMKNCQNSTINNTKVINFLNFDDLKDD